MHKLVYFLLFLDTSTLIATELLKPNLLQQLETLSAKKQLLQEKRKLMQQKDRVLQERNKNSIVLDRYNRILNIGGSPENKIRQEQQATLVHNEIALDNTVTEINRRLEEIENQLVTLDRTEKMS